MATFVGNNIKIIDKEDRILIVIMKKEKLVDSSSGRSKLLASSGGFVNAGEISGSKFEDKDVGLNLVVTVRDAKKTAKKTPAKKKAARDDDEE